MRCLSALPQGIWYSGRLRQRPPGVAESPVVDGLEDGSGVSWHLA